MRRGASFVLASHSPRRCSLLRQAGFSFEVLVPQSAEHSFVHLSIRELTISNALGKARAVNARRPDAVVLAADTLVALEGEIIGKPRNLSHARAILRRLSGRLHEVCTGVVIAGPNSRFAVLSELSRVRFRQLDDKLITAYLATVNPLDKAGAYAAQGSASRQIIRSVEGSFSNVVGLPMERVIPALAKFGIHPSASGSQRRFRDVALKLAPVPASKLGRGTKQ